MKTNGNKQQVKPKLKKKRKTFTYEEDQSLIELVQQYGTKNWELISFKIKTRTPRQCRERWKFYLSPNVNRSPWTLDEDQILFEKYNEYGPKWTIISKYFQNRSINNVKNRWNSIIRKIKSLKLNEKSEEDFYYCGRMITKSSSYLQRKDVKKNQISIEEKRNDQQFDPLDFYQISNLLNQLHTPV